jgi:hypothetical protein
MPVICGAVPQCCDDGTWLCNNGNPMLMCANGPGQVCP